ncbi:(Fe-S)-binding protein [Guyparkeria hydrothermalis]|uniref:(Fe-S)-binding protein n=1 Tax=Guyparkeria hydrothermalis TaxID=923 RepID=UPI0020224941|nr:(Fe-S)-binding protein [Guyparkeria hydrothermalis]MCL7744648.1 (Fe-S)-binding protein [Guyparkeria hydrothermalis]
MTPQPPTTPAVNESPAPLSLDEAIQRDALDCVMCGICVPHCPTFSLSGNEADGPRGRISLMLGISQGDLLPDADVRRHLDTCLTCRACETVCPSGVQYGRLIDNGRARLAQAQTSAAQPRALARHWRLLRDQLLTRRRRMGAASGLYRAATRLGLGGLVRRLTGPLGRALPRHPATPSSQPGSTDTPTRGTVGLFVGCTGSAMNAPAGAAARQVMRAMGYRVVTPAAQACCGAMHAHGGEPAAARELRARNARVFSGAEVETIVVVGTACRAELGALETEHGIAVREITEWLLERASEEWPALGTLDQQVAVHTPCSQRNHLRAPGATRELLSRIPGLELVELDGNERCCGAAGLQALLYPDEAERLREPKLESIDRIQPDVVVSANVGCATHLAAGADLEVRQPVELIAKALAATKP